MSAIKIDLTPEQQKTLKLFSYYCKGYGAKEVTRNFSFQHGGEEWSDDTWSSPQLKGSIESYKSIDNLIDDLTDKYELNYMGDDSDNLTEVTFDIDCVNNVLTIFAYQEVYEYMDSGDEYDAEDNENLLSFFNEMRNKNIKSATCNFSGGGDSGMIESDLELDNGESMDIPSLIEHFLYDMLENHQGGWEIDDGSQGTFTFDFTEGKVFLDFQLNTRENYKVDTSYEVHF